MTTDNADEKIYTFVNVVFKETDETTYCYLADFEIHAEDLAEVMTAEGKKYTVVAYIDRTTADKAPYPFEKLKHITSRVAKDSPHYAALYSKYILDCVTDWNKNDPFPEDFANDGDFEED